MAILAPLVSPSHDRFVTHHPRSGQFNEELTLFVGLTTAGRCALSPSRLDGQDQTPFLDQAPTRRDRTRRARRILRVTRRALRRVSDYWRLNPLISLHTISHPISII